MHWFNPAPVMDLVEVVQTVVTDPSVVEDVEALMAKVGKSDVTVGDRAGFIANALLFGYLNNAVRMYEAQATPPARTSTPPCASAAATRWARWRCST